MLEIIMSNKLSPEEFDWLQNRYLSLCEKSNISEENGMLIFKKIEKKYNKKGRSYHNLSHIYSFLKTFDQSQLQNDYSIIFEWSIWMHDLVYNPLKKNNELKSAKKTKKLLGKYLSEQHITEIYEIILSTARHQLYYQEDHHKLFLDIDLAIFASERKVYQKYTEAIREEYKMFPNFLYKKGRRGVLNHFLNRENIFFTSHFQNQYENIARENLNWELENLI